MDSSMTNPAMLRKPMSSSWVSRPLRKTGANCPGCSHADDDAVWWTRLSGRRRKVMTIAPRLAAAAK